MAVTSISTPFDCTLPSTNSGGSIKKPIKSVSKPCFGCDCGDEEIIPEDGRLGPVTLVTNERSNAMPHFHSVIGVATIISHANLTE
ncbi:hypothetical protein N7475_007015 [Penicillium sp. IBT 31633x]|nr:hypothetical protein N7475_007015 [Penicillium sp. IBT 31633x]